MFYAFSFTLMFAVLAAAGRKLHAKACRQEAEACQCKAQHPGTVHAGLRESGCMAVGGCSLLGYLRQALLPPQRGLPASQAFLPRSPAFPAPGWGQARPAFPGSPTPATAPRSARLHWSGGNPSGRSALQDLPSLSWGSDTAHSPGIVIILGGFVPRSFLQFLRSRQ